MDTLKKLFPFSFKDTKTNNGLVVAILIYLIAAVAVGLVVWLLSRIFGFIPVLGGIIGTILSIVSYLVYLYAVVGVVLAVLNRFGVIS